ncbi:glycosyltransferase [Veillonella caviae]|uniref:glycosyltransferase n=1 Tax=Veillonella caviae TaxID=248316 RepID=UPI002353E44F|nr:glycosyltransferase [Veillonella caviae]
MKQNKIALLISNMMSLAGTERVTALLANQLSSEFPCSVIIGHQDGPLVYPINSSVDIFVAHRKRNKRKLDIFESAYKIAKYLRKQEIGLLLVIGRNNSIVPFLVKCLYPKVKIIFCEHNTINNCAMPLNFRLKVRGMIYQALVNYLSSAIVVLTDKDFEYYRDIYPSISAKLSKIANISEVVLDKDILYNSHSKRIVSVGRINVQKGYEYTVEVAKRVFAKHPDWSWDIWGPCDSPYTQKIQSMIEDAGLSNHLHLCGTDPDIYKRYKEYSLYCMTSRWEGLPMVLLEAQANKLPIVSFNVYSGPSEVITNGVNGELIEPWNVDVMADSINHLIENQDLRERYSNHSQDNLGKFSAHNILQQWKILIQKYIDEG